MLCNGFVTLSICVLIIWQLLENTGNLFLQRCLMSVEIILQHNFLLCILNRKHALYVFHTNVSLKQATRLK